MGERLHELSCQLSALLDELQDEARQRDVRELQAPLAWLDEASRWLNYELVRLSGGLPREAVPFTYIPTELRK
jgi:hypothetical protein